MKRKTFLLVTMLLICTMALAIPAQAATKADLLVNGDPIKQVQLLVQNGQTMIMVNDWAKLAGADVSQDASSVRVLENGATLSMIPGQTNAYFNGGLATMAAPPQNISGQVYVPLRFVAETFGFEVGWDNAAGLVTLDRTEIREDLTAYEMLAKADKAAMDVNTYTMDGKMKMTLKMQMDGLNMAEMIGADQMAMDIDMTGQIQNDPMQIYLKTTIVPGSGLDDVLEMQDTMMEIYMTESNMYMKVPEMGWLAQEMPFSADFWQEQQSIQSDPLKAIQQMEEWGMLLNYGNDVTKGDQGYYAIKASMDVDKFAAALQEMMGQIMPGMAGGASAAEVEQAQQLMQTLLEKSKIDFNYTAFVNKETMFTDEIDMDVTIDLAMSPADFGAVDDLSQAAMPGDIRILMNIQGGFQISELNTPFAAPDVSDAKSVSEIAAAL